MKDLLKNSFNKAGVLLLLLVVPALFGFMLKPADDWQAVSAETAATELMAINKRLLKNDRYSFSVKYTSYKEYSGIDPYESKGGTVIRDGVNIYSQLLGTTTIQNKQLRIVADSAKKYVRISDPFTGGDQSFNLEDYIKVIGNCRSIKRKQAGEQVAYRFEPKATTGIVAQEIYIGTDFFEKSVIYYANKNKTRTNDKTVTETLYPRLEIKVTDFKKLETVSRSLFSTDDLVSITKNGINLKGKYKSFKFFDGRIRK